MKFLSFGALILYSKDVSALVSFYKSIGLPLEEETHGADGPVHFACEIGEVHFAIYASDIAGTTVPRSHGASMLGWKVDSVSEIHEKLKIMGARVQQGPQKKLWGTRMIALDPDGRSVEFWD